MSSFRAVFHFQIITADYLIPASSSALPAATKRAKKVIPHITPPIKQTMLITIFIIYSNLFFALFAPCRRLRALYQHSNTRNGYSLVFWSCLCVNSICNRNPQHDIQTLIFFSIYFSPFIFWNKKRAFRLSQNAPRIIFIDLFFLPCASVFASCRIRHKWQDRRQSLIMA